MMSQAAVNKNPDLSTVVAPGMVLPPGFAVAPGMANFAVVAPSAAKGAGGATAADMKKGGVAKKAPRKKWKKPADKPKRPLSAYNLFFASERKRIISEMDAAGKLDKDVLTASSAADDAASTDAKRRPHRKTSGVGFRTLAQKISERWKGLDAKTKAPFQAEAAKEKEKYLVVLAAWKEKKANEDMKEKAVQLKLQEEQVIMRQLQHDQIRDQHHHQVAVAAAATAASLPTIGAAPPTLLVVPPGMTPQQQQQYITSLGLAGITFNPANAQFAKAMPNVGVPATSLYAMANPAVPPTLTTTDGQKNASSANANDGGAKNTGGGSHPGASLPRVQPINSEVKQPSSLLLQQQQQAQLSTTAPGGAASVPTAAAVSGAPTAAGVSGMSQVDWESMHTVVNQSDPSSMAAAAINAASGGDENPIDAINRAQAFLSNLKASLETGQSTSI